MMPISAADLEHFFDPEPLHPDLVPYLEDVPNLGMCLRHPYVYSVPYHEISNRQLNRQYQYKIDRLKEALSSHDWLLYIRLHERPYRTNALYDIRNMMTDKEYWSAIAYVWIDSENIHAFDQWESLWNDQRPGRRKHVMNTDENAALNKLPNRLIIYRGVGDPAGVQGLSWTTERPLAIWFANRYGAGFGMPLVHVARGEINKRFVLAHFTGRGEHEIVVLPHLVRNITIEKLPAKHHRKPD